MLRIRDISKPTARTDYYSSALTHKLTRYSLFSHHYATSAGYLRFIKLPF